MTAHVNAPPPDPGPCPHATVSDQLRCVDCGATIERLDPQTAIATMRATLRKEPG